MKQQVIISAISNLTGKLEVVSTRVTPEEAIQYLNSEYNLHKLYPSSFGLYGSYSKIKVKFVGI
jgi:hypothetical protein